MVPRGLEPRTLRLLAVRSNQLSYETPADSNQTWLFKGCHLQKENHDKHCADSTTCIGRHLHPAQKFWAMIHYHVNNAAPTNKIHVHQTQMTAVGFEPTPLRTGAWSQRLRPLGQTVIIRSWSCYHISFGHGFSMGPWTYSHKFRFTFQGGPRQNFAQIIHIVCRPPNKSCGIPSIFYQSPWGILILKRCMLPKRSPGIFTILITFGFRFVGPLSEFRRKRSEACATQNHFQILQTSTSQGHAIFSKLSDVEMRVAISPHHWLQN